MSDNRLYALESYVAKLEARIAKLEDAVLLSGSGCNCDGGDQWGHDIHCEIYS